MPDSNYLLLCSKLCWHNYRKPIEGSAKKGPCVLDFFFCGPPACAYSSVKSSETTCMFTESAGIVSHDLIVERELVATGDGCSMHGSDAWLQSLHGCRVCMVASQHHQYVL